MDFSLAPRKLPPNGRLVRNAAEYVHRMAMVLVETDGIGYQCPTPAPFALVVVANTRWGLTALAVLLGVEGNRAFVVLACVVAAAGRFLQAPDAAFVGQALDLLDDTVVGFDRRVILAYLAANRGDRAAAGRMHLVVLVTVRRGSRLAVFGAGGNAEIGAVRHLAVVDLDGPFGPRQDESGGQGHPRTLLGHWRTPFGLRRAEALKRTENARCYTGFPEITKTYKKY